MIRIKNTSEYILILKKAGVFAATTGQDFLTVPAAGFIKAVVASFGLMGTDGTGAPTQDVQVGIIKNGTSIFGSSATSILWAHAGQLGTANTPSNASSVGAPSVNPTPVAKGDKLRLDGLQILNGTSPTQPSDLCVYLVIARGQGWAPEAMLPGQLCELDV
jgi:hypothetical protein